MVRYLGMHNGGQLVRCPGLEERRQSVLSRTGGQGQDSIERNKDPNIPSIMGQLTPSFQAQIAKQLPCNPSKTHSNS